MLKRSLAVVVISGLLVLGLMAGCAQEPSRPNIVVVVLDTVREDTAALAGAGPSPTPNLDRLGSEGTVFTNAWATAPWTVPSHASMLTGLLPSSHGCTGAHAKLDKSMKTFADYLTEQGYDTAAFFSNPWLTDRMTGMMRAFDEQHVEAGHDTRILSLVDQGGEATSFNISRWLRDRRGERPFLMFVNYLEPHLPYCPPEEYRSRYLPDLPSRSIVTTDWAHEFNAGVHPADGVDWDRVVRLYLGDVATADAFLGRLIGELESHGLYDDTVIVVASDHGENLGDHGYMDHQFGLFETLLAVPLVVRAPRLMEPGIRKDPVMLTDVFPTVLEIAGAEAVAELPHARSLLAPPAAKDRPLIAEYSGAGPGLVEILKAANPKVDVSRMVLASASVRVGDLRFTIDSSGYGDLQDFAVNPADRTDLNRRGRAISERMLRLLPAIGPAAADVEVDEETRESLRSLGYLP